MQYINYLLFKIFTRLIGFLPFVILYQVSDVLSWILRNILNYRTVITKQNLQNAFPEKNTEEINDIFKKSYSNLADIIVEGIKGFHMSQAQVKERYKFTNIEKVDQFFNEGKHVILYASHYGNWEWGPLAVGHYVKHRSLGIVKLVRNKYINAFLQSNRCGKNVYVADISTTTESIAAYSDQPTQFVFISDQGPRNSKKAQWMTFLNQDTPCLYGADRLARKNNWPAFNVKTTRIKRGYYELEYELLFDNTGDTNDGEITEKYMRSLEKQIIAKPEDWLWSHRRWKRAHERPSA